MAESQRILKESITTTAYGNFIVDVGLRVDDLALMVALMPCLLGYGEVGLWLRKEVECETSDVYLEGNPYWRYGSSWLSIHLRLTLRWIEDFPGEGYQTTCHMGIGE